MPHSPTFISETTDLQPVHALAHVIWPATYAPILTKEQISYMLEKLYAVPALEAQQEQGQVFLLLQKENQPIGFAAYSCLQPEERVYKLQKIYLLPACQGAGYGRLLLAEVMRRCRELGGKTLELNVHRRNPAFHFYVRNGFSIHQTVDIPFGPFTLTDYIMRRPLDFQEGQPPVPGPIS